MRIGGNCVKGILLFTMFKDERAGLGGLVAGFRRDKHKSKNHGKCLSDLGLVPRALKKINFSV